MGRRVKGPRGRLTPAEAARGERDRLAGIGQRVANLPEVRDVAAAAHRYVAAARLAGQGAVGEEGERRLRAKAIAQADLLAAAGVWYEAAKAIIEKGGN